MNWLTEKMIKNCIFTCFLLCFLTQAIAAPSFKCLQNQHKYGIPATSTVLDEIEKTLPTEPPLSKSGKSLVTINKFGFDVIDDASLQESWLVNDIVQFSKTAKSPMLEIGGGYGRLSKHMLNAGATVIYNDLEPSHLIYGRKNISPSQREHLYLNAFVFPRGMILKPNTLSGVVMYRVAHFMQPDEFEEGIAKIKRWLVPGGKIFIAVLPPQHGEFRDKVLSTYEKRWQEGNLWPGYSFSSLEILPEQAYALPRHLHLMDQRPLESVLKKYGFTVEKTGFIDMKKFGNSEKRTGQELFGIVAKKES